MKTTSRPTRSRGEMGADLAPGTALTGAVLARPRVARTSGRATIVARAVAARLTRSGTATDFAHACTGRVARTSARAAHGVVGAILASAFLAAVPATPASAEVDLGGTIAWHDDAELGLGVWIGAPFRSIGPEFSGAADFLWFFPDEGPRVDVSYWELNGNLYYTFREVRGPVIPAVGLGLNVAHTSVSVDRRFEDDEFDADDTDLGLNLIGRTTFGRASLRPFAELRIEVGGGDGIVLAGGFSFGVGD